MIVGTADSCSNSLQSSPSSSTLLTAFRQYVATFVNLLYPIHCFSCGRSLHNDECKYLCPKCLNGISYITGICCPRCGMGLGNYSLVSKEGCAACKSHSLRFDGAFSAAYYEGAIKELIHIIEKLLGKKLKIEYLPPRQGDVMILVADIFKAKHNLNWEPTTSLEEGIKFILNK